MAREDSFRVHFDGWTTPSKEFPRRSPSNMDQLHGLLLQDSRLLMIFDDWRAHNWMIDYCSPSWTIALEFRASLILFLTHVVLYFVRRRLRILCIVLLVMVGVWIEAFDIPLFWLGYLIAELSPLIGATPLEKEKTHAQLPTVLLIALGLLGLHLCSYPGWGAENTPTFMLLARWSPWENETTTRFYTSGGAFLIIFTLDRLPSVRSILNAPPIQYLGRISFSFYLTHIAILYTVGLSTFHFAWSITGAKNEATNLIGFSMGYCIMWAVIICVSDIFYRCVDRHCNSLGFTVAKRILTE